MKKYILALDCYNNKEANRSLFISETNDIFSKASRYLRTSPIFLVNKPHIDSKLFCTGKILLVYSLDAFYLISRINLYFKEDKSIYVFQTLGLASILIYSTNSETNFDLLIDQLQNNVFGYEVFFLEKNKLKDIKKEFEPLRNNNKSNIDFNLLDFEEQVILNEIIPSLNFFISFSKSYLPIYQQYSTETEKAVLDLYYRIIYLKDKIDKEKFREYLFEIFNDIQIVDRAIKSYDYIKSHTIKNIHYFQLLDELTQIASILRAINYQAFFGLNCFNLDYTRTGYNALFGTGLAYGAIFSIYAHMHESFCKKINLAILKESYSLASPPELQKDPTQFDLWRINLQNSIGIDKLKKIENNNSFFHLLYYSNRLGFRETKRAISVAQQTISLGYTPEWSYNTLTHEFLHAHVRALLSIIYPIDENGETKISPKIFELFTNRHLKKNSCGNILAFLKVSILIIVNNLHLQALQLNSTEIKIPDNDFSEGLLLDILKRYHHEIDEIIVHILDFHYFYKSNADIYIKSIWISWLTLPVTISRIPEYLIRTIVSISTFKEASRNEQFDWAIEKTYNVISSLKDSIFINHDQIDLVLNTLKDESFLYRFRLQYFEAWSRLADITLKFLYSIELKDLLNIDFENDYIEYDECSYRIDNGNYAAIRIDSPINFLNHILHKSLSDKSSEALDFNEIECNTAWLISILNSKNNSKN